MVLGVVGTGLGAFAGGKPWAAPDGGAGSTLVDKSGGHVPLAAALGLVGLACWGVLLVTRGRLRRAVAVLGALVAVGLVATAVVGRASALDSARHATVDLGRVPTGARPRSTVAWRAESRATAADDRRPRPANGRVRRHGNRTAEGIPG